MPSEISTIIFSKNRACQLELLLHSLDLSATVLYTCDPEFQSGYDKLFEMYPEVVFLRETDFHNQVISLIQRPYILFLVDDDFMLEPFTEDCPEFTEFKQNTDLISLSLRLAPDYHEAPTMINNTWPWRGLKHDWGYPMSVSAHIFRREDILPIMKRKSFSMPNDLEVALRKNPPAKDLMLCRDRANFINNSTNQVQFKYNSKHLGLSAHDINDKFLAGYRISLEDIRAKAKEAKSCFLMTDYQYEIY